MRRLLYIYPKVQLPFTGTWMAVVTAELVLLALSISVVGRFSARLTDDVAIYFQYGAMSFLILLFSTINLFVATKLSHRLAGPLVQILRALDLAKRGDYSARPRLRSNDYLHEVSRALNHLLQHLERQQDHSKFIEGEYSEPKETNGHLNPDHENELKKENVR